jgi:hypothetical protein
MVSRAGAWSEGIEMGGIVEAGEPVGVAAAIEGFVRGADEPRRHPGTRPTPKPHAEAALIGLVEPAFDGGDAARQPRCG